MSSERWVYIGLFALTVVVCIAAVTILIGFVSYVHPDKTTMQFVKEKTQEQISKLNI